MDRFLVRRSKPDGTGVSKDAEASPKRQRTNSAQDDPAPGAEALGDPQKIISWNANGLAVQLRNNWSLIKQFLENEDPDVLCLQEVRLPAAGPKGCKRGDGQKRSRGEAKYDSAQEKADWDLVQRTLVATFAKMYSFHWSLADWKYAGTLMMIRRSLRPSCITYTCSTFGMDHAAHFDPANRKWHPEGRIICASFATFDLLATYSPNNGSDPESFARRAAWDKALNEAVVQRNRPLLWIGDLNVAAERIDVTHPDWFAQQCYQGEPADMRGQPGFTEGERRRFKELLVTGRLVDAYRRLHPSDDVPPAAGPYFTWRGHPPVHQTVAKYHGKGMRIDYALVAEEMLARLEACDILGQGADRNGFLGSDHCPLRCTLQKESSAGSPPSIAVVEQPSTLSSQVDSESPAPVTVLD